MRLEDALAVRLATDTDPDSLRSRDEQYERLEKLGEGTYAVVHKARVKTSDEIVAVKRIKMGQFKDGLDMSAIREIKALQELRHPNVILLHDVYTLHESINLVLEYLDHDLEMVIKEKSVLFGPADIKSWMVMTLRGLEHCHRSWILHRDMKPNNLLIAADGELKLADFGLARTYGEPTGNMSPQVVTRWYRAPELLFGARDYSYGVDMWAVGCIFAELMLRVPYMAGETDIEQLQTIFRALGSPTDKEWPLMKKLPSYVQFGPFPKPDMRQLFTAASNDALDLLRRMLAFDPLKRISAKDALLHAYFKRKPYPTPPSKLPRVAGTRALDQETDHAQQANVGMAPSSAASTTRRGAGGKRKADDTDVGVGDGQGSAHKDKRIARQLAFK